MDELRKLIRSIPDFPKKGIMFRDITTLLLDAQGFKKAIDALEEHYKDTPVDKIMAAEARGFIFGAALALRMGKGFIPVRKRGKLPYDTVSAVYELEYGTDELHVHIDAIKPGEKILLIDDLLATGGTMKACADLVEKLGGKVAGCCFVIELSFLKGREKLKDYDVFTLFDYASEEV